jgi:hypothetical protein
MYLDEVSSGFRTCDIRVQLAENELCFGSHALGSGFDCHSRMVGGCSTTSRGGTDSRRYAGSRLCNACRSCFGFHQTDNVVA